MSWWSGLDVAFGLVIALLVPGLLVGTVLRLPRVLLLTVAPGVSVAVLGLAPVLLAPLGIRWNAVSAAASTLLVVVLFAVLRLLLRRWWRGPRDGGARDGAPPDGGARDDRPGDGRPRLWPVLLGALVAVPFAVLPLKDGMGRPDIPPQTWDAVFHLNALRAIADTGDGSSLHVGRLAQPMGDVVFYPAAWHDIGVLAMDENVIVSANVYTLVLGGLVWPLVLAGLAALLAPGSRLAPMAAALAGTALVSFPARMVSYGTLWPNALAYMLVPAALAVTIVMIRDLREWRRDRAEPFPVSEAIALLAVLGGAALAHPNAVLAYGVIGGPIWLVAWWRALRSALRRGGPRTWTAVVLAPVLLVLAVLGFMSTDQFATLVSHDREPYGSVGDAIIGAFTDAQLPEQGFGNTERSWLLAALVVLGMVATVVARRHRWLIAAMLATTALFALSVDSSLPGHALVGPWYADPVRVGGMVALVVPLLVAVGIAWASGALARRLPVPADRRQGVREAVATVVIVGLVVGTGGLRADVRATQVEKNYVMIPESGLNGMLTLGELEMFRRADETLPDDAVVLGNPFTGAGLLYAVSGVDVVYPHLRGEWGPDAELLATSFDRIASDPAVCAALEEQGIDYVYDDDLLYWPDHPSIAEYSGLEDVAALGDALEPVDSGGGATIYRITACDA